MNDIDNLLNVSERTLFVVNLIGDVNGMGEKAINISDEILNIKKMVFVNGK